MTNYRDLLPVVVETSGAQMPDGFDSWGIKTVLPDLTTTRNFRWASPGGVNISNDRLERGNGGAGPRVPGDGLCVATTWRGMASMGIPARTLLLVAYRAADIIGRDDSEGILRIGGAVASVALVDGERFIREHGKGMDLRRSNLRGMILQCADLQGTDLSDADLQGTDLWGADLSDAHLRGADLRGANLCDADLPCANLQGADLSDADLWDADLSDANLQGALLQRADLRDANLQRADLQYADLSDADLSDADLQGADLQDVDLSDADLQDADLSDADLRGAYRPGSMPPDGWTLDSFGLLVRDGDAAR